MGSGVNGYVTVNVGVANGHNKSMGNSARSLGEDERNRRARRLRHEGWSYRRIAATLEMSYASVCHLLDGDEARLPASAERPMPLPPRRLMLPSAAATVRPATTVLESAAAVLAMRLEELAAQIVILQQRLDTVLALNESHRQSLARLERSVVATLQTEHRALGQRLQAGVKALLERMLPASLRTRPPTAEERDDG